MSESNRRIPTEEQHLVPPLQTLEINKCVMEEREKADSLHLLHGKYLLTLISNYFSVYG